ncbi:MAG: NarK/NasA family nitrate transporter [Planctomycetaceae bacterium]|nr:NarK/NasA family nitrate transporter [Planctomycetaceae bacterium]
MNLRDFRRAGHLPTLGCALLYFTISCMAWMMVGALANSIIPDLGHLSDSRKGLMVAVPLLGGSLLRLVLGPLADHIGARKTAMLGLALTVIPLLMGWLWADSYPKVLLLGLMLGVAGASFAAALPLASRWYPPQFQGLVLGIAGAGNGGTALATLLGLWVAATWGWHAAFGLALIPVLATLALFALLAKDSPSHPAPKTLADYAAVLRIADAGWFCLFYAITFGGFVGLVSFLGIFFRDQYALTKVQAGAFVTLCAISGSLIRPLGGYLSDRFGGVRVLLLLYLGVAATMAGVSSMPPLVPCTLMLATGLVLMGMGNGAVFQLVPQRFPEEIGVITGIVGAAGGFGGFILPTLLGILRQWTHSYSGGFLAFALIGSTGAVALAFVSQSWEGTFLGKGGVVLVGPTAGRVEVLAPLAEEAVV